MLLVKQALMMNFVRGFAPSNGLLTPLRHKLNFN
jgi:hypothetical protein